MVETLTGVHFGDGVGRVGEGGIGEEAGGAVLDMEPMRQPWRIMAVG